MARSSDFGKSAGGFLERWARRKADARHPSVTASPPTAAAIPTETTLGPPVQAQPALTEEEIAALPPIDSLGPNSDYSPFLRPGVPMALRRQALAHAWRTDPVISTFRGLNDYDEDFNAPHFTRDLLKTVWEFGKGMPNPLAPKAEGRPADPLVLPSDVQETPPAITAPNLSPNRPPELPTDLAADLLPVPGEPAAEGQAPQPEPIQKIRRGGATPQ